MGRGVRGVRQDGAAAGLRADGGGVGRRGAPGGAAPHGLGEGLGPGRRAESNREMMQERGTVHSNS